MHDVGKSGWFLLIPIYNLILASTDGVNGDNEYGTDPKVNVQLTNGRKPANNKGLPKVAVQFSADTFW